MNSNLRTGQKPPDNPVISYYVKSYIDALSRYLTINNNMTLLEIGCGNGHFTYHFDKICKAYGIDKSLQAVENNPARYVSVMDCLHLQYEDNSFDIVFCHSVLHHVSDIGRAISEMSRVSRGYVVIVEPNRCNPINLIAALSCKDERAILRLSASYLKGIIKNYDLRIMASFTFGMPLPTLIPASLLPIFKLMNKRFPFGWDNFIITQSSVDLSKINQGSEK